MRQARAGRSRMMMALLCGATLVLVSGEAVRSAVIEIGGAKQLLGVDESLLESARGVTFEMHPPQLHALGREPLVRPDSPWELRDQMHMNLYSSVLPKRDGSGFQAWYYLLSQSFDSRTEPELAEQNGVVAYAELSADLSNVTKPLLHQHRFLNGSNANNYLGGLSEGWQESKGAREGCSVWYDEKATLGGPYVSQSKLAKGSAYGLAFSVSPDGITGWRDVMRVDYSPFDTQTVGTWDMFSQRYAIYTRGCTHDTAAEKVLGFRCVRRISTCPGKGMADNLRSLTNCTEQSISMQTDAVDNGTHTPEDHTCSKGECGMPTLDYYGGMVWAYENHTFMFPQRTWHWSARKYPATDPLGPETHMYAPGIIDVGLAVSRDGGKNFSHLGGREAFIPVGSAGGWASKMVWALPSPVVVGDEIWIFYAGQNVDHNGDVDAFSKTGGTQSGLSVAKMRLDGFVSLSAPLHSTDLRVSAWPGEVITKPLRFEGSRLELNVQTSGGGSVLVELQDGATGAALPNFTLADCVPMIVDSVNATVIWNPKWDGKPNADVSALQNHPAGVRVRLQMVGARLFALQFVK